MSGLFVAIVGAGPAGFYAAEMLLRAEPSARIDLIDRLPVPFGLARHGVAPDHPKLRAPITLFERIGAMPGMRFFGDVEVGRTLMLDDLRAAYDAVLLAHGAQGDEALELPGAWPGAVRPARELVAWANAMPDVPAASFDLQQADVVVIGQGNVAIDIARLLSRPAADFESTDISDRALAALRRSRVRHVHLVGRRGPAQARFTSKELRELGELAGVGLHVEPDDLRLGPASQAELASPTADTARRNLALLTDWAARPPRPDAARTLHLHFQLAPEALERDGDGQGWLRLRRMRLDGPPGGQRALPTEATLRLRCDLVIASIGFRVRALPGLPMHGTPGLDHAGGRLLGLDGAPLGRLYVAGWAKRGPGGVIGSNRACAEETVATLLADRPGWPARAPGAAVAAVAALWRRVDAAGHRPVGWADWQRLDALERERGRLQGRPRVRFDERAAVREALAAGPPGSSTLRPA